MACVTMASAWVRWQVVDSILELPGSLPERVRTQNRMTLQIGMNRCKVTDAASHLLNRRLEPA